MQPLHRLLPTGLRLPISRLLLTALLLLAAAPHLRAYSTHAHDYQPAYSHPGDSQSGDFTETDYSPQTGYSSQTRVRNFFPTNECLTPGFPSQLLQSQQEKTSQYDGIVPGCIFWTHFDPEGLAVADHVPALGMMLWNALPPFLVPSPGLVDAALEAHAIYNNEREAGSSVGSSARSAAAHAAGRVSGATAVVEANRGEQVTTDKNGNLAFAPMSTGERVIHGAVGAVQLATLTVGVAKGTGSLAVPKAAAGTALEASAAETAAASGRAVATEATSQAPTTPAATAPVPTAPAPAPAAAATGLETRGIKPAPGTRIRPEGVPEEWRIRPTDSKGGTEYYNPRNKNESVRIMQGNPSSPYPNSQIPYARQRNSSGIYLRQDGTPSTLPRGGKADPDAHIPLDKFKFKK